MNQFAGNPWHFPPENIDFTSILAVFPGKVNQIAGNPWHFPPGNVDFTVILAIFPRKVNQIPTNLWHFPLENIDSTAIFAVFPGKVNQIPANLLHFPPETKFDNPLYSHSACIPRPPIPAVSAVRQSSLRRLRYQDHTRPTQEKNLLSRNKAATEKTYYFISETIPFGAVFAK